MSRLPSVAAVLVNALPERLACWLARRLPLEVLRAAIAQQSHRRLQLRADIHRERLELLEQLEGLELLDARLKAMDAELSGWRP